MNSRIHWNRIIFISLLFIPLLSSVQAQYRVYTWDNYEKGIFPANLEMTQDATKENVNVFSYNAPGLPPAIHQGIAERECGGYGLSFRTGETQQYLKTISNITLDRDTLGPSGKALFQSDFYLPAENAALTHSAAVVAVLQNDDGSRSPFSFYRFGIVKGDRVFFSFTNNTKAPAIYHQANLSSLNLDRPGWHRFQIIFQGREEIICAVDGAATPFSPIQEPTLRKLMPGIMVTSSTKGDGILYTDNLSIQWTVDDIPLPESPWSNPSATVQQETYTAPALNSAPSVPVWFTSSEEAWRATQSTKKPLLVLFYAPRAKAYRKLEQIISANEGAREFLNHFVLLKIDLDQLEGGSIAQRFNIYRVPCLMVMDESGRERARETYLMNSDWRIIFQKLESSIKG